VKTVARWLQCGKVTTRAVIGLCAAVAVLGGIVGVVVADLIGLGGDETTVLASQPTPAADTGPSALPLLGNRFDPASLYTRRAPGVVTIYADLGADGQSQGSGFVVDGKGTILTNAHVVTNVATSTDVQGARALYVEFRDGDRVPAAIVGWDLFNDIGVVRVDPDDHAVQAVPLGDSAAVRVGEPVAAIGSPFGNQSSLAVGVVSATGRSIDSLTSNYAVADAIQIDAPINRGNSGGPLFDARGRVIGINAQIRSDSGTAEGVGFAIPINVARRALEQLERTGRVSYAYIGVTTQDVTPGMAKRFGIDAPRGALVANVEDDTPAARAGIRGGDQSESYNGLAITFGGDVILSIAGVPVRSSEDVSRIVTEQLHAGQTVDVVVLRDGSERRTIRVTLGERPASHTG
jgi:S1-C subfamily serine protease